MTIEVFRRGMNREVSAKLQRTLVERRSESIVYREQRISIMCKARQLWDITDSHQWVGRRF